ncbi:hypothetical protein RJ639_036296 [Escallonia herrerae]|uniref:LOB domain-containing protein n=1 Tax=Escallonia herrerae TaxID=1293975 RepID=A0AA88WQP3_9ASTE|nr:hypothetical protein RJ639_036296 [Escallonia herrerae]
MKIVEGNTEIQAANVDGSYSTESVAVKMASSSYSSTPCAACKFLRRKCVAGCIFAPYFPPEEPHKFANVHKIFGASNVSKLLNEIQPHQREDAVNSLAYEAEARLKDPVYGCVGAISVLQRQVLHLQKELDATNADLFRYTNNEMPHAFSAIPETGELMDQTIPHQGSPQYGRRTSHRGASRNYDSGFPLPYAYPWNSDPSGNSPNGDGENSM